MKTKEIESMLVISTGHLPLNEFEVINHALYGADTINSFRAINHEYGVLLVIHDLDDDPNDSIIEFTKENLPYLWKIVKYCHDNKIKWVNFDQDGGVYEDFETFDW